MGNSKSMLFAYGRDAHPGDLSEEQQAFQRKPMLQVWFVGGTINIDYHL